LLNTSDVLDVDNYLNPVSENLLVSVLIICMIFCYFVLYYILYAAKSAILNYYRFLVKD